MVRQKTAYEMRISDWSSDVCSSDLSARHQRGTIDLPPIPEAAVSNPPANLQRLLDIMARLRDRENGWPWAIEQIFATIVPYTTERAEERRVGQERVSTCRSRWWPKP